VVVAAAAGGQAGALRHGAVEGGGA